MILTVLKRMASWVRLLLFLVWLVLVVLIGAHISSMNADIVTLRLGVWSHQYSSGLIVCFSIVFGMVVGALSMLPLCMRFLWQARKLKSMEAKK